VDSFIIVQTYSLYVTNRFRIIAYMLQISL